MDDRTLAYSRLSGLPSKVTVFEHVAAAEIAVVGNGDDIAAGGLPVALPVVPQVLGIPPSREEKGRASEVCSGPQQLEDARAVCGSQQAGVAGDEPWQDAQVLGVIGNQPEFVRLMDLMPTFIEWGGGEVPDNLDARSLVPLVDGETPADWPDSVYCESHGEVWGYSTQRMVRTERWKYVYIPHDLDELYDLQADPAEMRSLIDDPGHADVVSDMRARLLGWNDATNDMFQWKWVRWNFPEPVSPF